MTKKLMVFMLTAIMMLGTFGLSGCGRKTFEVDGWTLFQYNISQGEYKGKRINIVSANSETLVVDGVLHIPAKIGKYDIHGFGRPSQGMFGSDAGEDFWINEDLAVDIKRIVVSAELHVDSSFYANFGTVFDDDMTIYVEFLSNTFERVYNIGGWSGGVTVISIIPDGTTQRFINRRPPENPPNPETFIEKSKYLEDKNND